MIEHGLSNACECLLTGLDLTGIPHKTTSDDVYNGHFIPKGSLIHPNLWFVV